MNKTIIAAILFIIWLAYGCFMASHIYIAEHQSDYSFTTLLPKPLVVLYLILSCCFGIYTISAIFSRWSDKD